MWCENRHRKLPDEFRFVFRTASQRPEYEQSFRLRFVLRIVHNPVQTEFPFVQGPVAEKDAQVLVQKPTGSLSIIIQ